MNETTEQVCEAGGYLYTYRGPSFPCGTTYPAPEPPATDTPCLECEPGGLIPPATEVRTEVLPPARRGEQLPVTGGDVLQLGLAGLGAVVVGAVLARRRARVTSQ